MKSNNHVIISKEFTLSSNRNISKACKVVDEAFDGLGSPLPFIVYFLWKLALSQLFSLNWSPFLCFFYPVRHGFSMLFLVISPLKENKLIKYRKIKLDRITGPAERTLAGN
jgi:hypothetical protein